MIHLSYSLSQIAQGDRLEIMLLNSKSFVQTQIIPISSKSVNIQF